MAGKRWTWLRGKTAQKHVRTYISLAIIPVLLLGVLFYAQSYIALKQKHENLLLIQVEQVKNDFDGKIALLESATVHFASQPLGQDEQGALDAQGLIMQLSAYQENYPFLHDVLYYPRFGVDVYTPSGKTAYVDYQREAPFGKELDMVQFFSMLNKLQAPKLLAGRMVVEQGASSSLFYLAPVPPLDGQATGVLVFIVDKSYFDDTVTRYCGVFEGYFLIQNDFLEPIYSFDHEADWDKDDAVRSLAGMAGIGVMRPTLKQQEFLAVRAVSSNYHFTYTCAQPLRAFRAPIMRQLRLYGIVFALVVGVLIAVSAYIGIRSFRPVQKLADDLLPQGEGAPRGDMFELLHRRYENIKDESATLQRRIQIDGQKRRGRVLRSLLHGHYADRESLQEAIEQTGPPFRYPTFFAIALYWSEGLPASMPSFPQGECMFALPQGDVYAVEEIEPNGMLMLANAQGTWEAVAQALCDALCAGGAPAQGMGVGLPYDDPLRMDLSCCEAFIALQYGGCAPCYFTKQIFSGHSYLCPEPQGAALRHSLIAGNQDLAVQLLRGMAKEVQAKEPPFLLSRCFCYYIVSLLLQANNTLGLDLEARALAHAASHQDVGEFESIAAQSIAYLCLQAQAQKEKSELSRASALLDYVQEHFCEYTLSTESVAQYFGLSESQVRRMFKEKVGCGVTSYAATLRLDYIKEKLASTDAPVRELILQVGYTDVSSFTRKFKASEGMTPGQYREYARQRATPQ